MTHPYYHAVSSARAYGGEPSDYLPVHEWLDQSKEHFCDFRHRAMRHHAEGIFECERIFGAVIVNSAGRAIPTRYVAEQHIREDCGGRIPTMADWLSRIDPEPWMAQATPVRRLGTGTRPAPNADEEHVEDDAAAVTEALSETATHSPRTG